MGLSLGSFAGGVASGLATGGKLRTDRDKLSEARAARKATADAKLKKQARVERIAQLDVLRKSLDVTIDSIGEMRTAEEPSPERGVTLANAEKSVRETAETIRRAEEQLGLPPSPGVNTRLEASRTKLSPKQEAKRSFDAEISKLKDEGIALQKAVAAADAAPDDKILRAVADRLQEKLAERAQQPTIASFLVPLLEKIRDEGFNSLDDEEKDAFNRARNISFLDALLASILPNFASQLGAQTSATEPEVRTLTSQPEIDEFFEKGKKGEVVIIDGKKFGGTN